MRPFSTSLTDASIHSRAVSCKCDVTVWDDQVALFELAMKTYGTVDVVVRLTPPTHDLRTQGSDTDTRYQTLG